MSLIKVYLVAILWDLKNCGAVEGSAFSALWNNRDELKKDLVHLG